MPSFFDNGPDLGGFMGSLNGMLSRLGAAGMPQAPQGPGGDAGQIAAGLYKPYQFGPLPQGQLPNFPVPQVNKPGMPTPKQPGDMLGVLNQIQSQFQMPKGGQYGSGQAPMVGKTPPQPSFGAGGGFGMPSMTPPQLGQGGPIGGGGGFGGVAPNPTSGVGRPLPPPSSMPPGMGGMMGGGGLGMPGGGMPTNPLGGMPGMGGGMMQGGGLGGMPGGFGMGGPPPAGGGVMPPPGGGLGGPGGGLGMTPGGPLAGGGPPGGMGQPPSGPAAPSFGGMPPLGGGGPLSGSPYMAPASGPAPTMGGGGGMPGMGGGPPSYTPQQLDWAQNAPMQYGPNVGMPPGGAPPGGSFGSGGSFGGPPEPQEYQPPGVSSDNGAQPLGQRGNKNGGVGMNLTEDQQEQQRREDLASSTPPQQIEGVGWTPVGGGATAVPTPPQQNIDIWPRDQAPPLMRGGPLSPASRGGTGYPAAQQSHYQQLMDRMRQLTPRQDYDSPTREQQQQMANIEDEMQRIGPPANSRGGPGMPGGPAPGLMPSMGGYLPPGVTTEPQATADDGSPMSQGAAPNFRMPPPAQPAPAKPGARTQAMDAQGRVTNYAGDVPVPAEGPRELGDAQIQPSQAQGRPMHGYMNRPQRPQRPPQRPGQRPPQQARPPMQRPGARPPQGGSLAQSLPPPGL